VSDRVGGVDVASGARGGDAFAASVARVRGGLVVQEGLRVYAPPFSPEDRIAEVARWLGSYGVREVWGDRYGAELVVDAFRRHGVTYRASDLDRSALYLELLALVNSGRVRLLDDPRLLRELRGLQRSRGAGRDRVDHPRGAHDDVANATAMAVVHAARRLHRRCDYCSDPDCQGWHVMSGAAAPPRPAPEVEAERAEGERIAREVARAAVENEIRRSGVFWR
jgi:hypothetical protein